jgi:hypothetical protein
MTFAIKAAISDARAKTFVLPAQKTMYGGKHIAAGDTVFLFASETDGGDGLIARGVVTSAEPVAKKRGIARQTPRVSVTIKRTALAKRPLGRDDLKPFNNGTTLSPKPSSISSSTVSQPTRSSASRTRRQISSTDSSDALDRFCCIPSNPLLILRSIAQRCVSKDGHDRGLMVRDGADAPPHHEGLDAESYPIFFSPFLKRGPLRW